MDLEVEEHTEQNLKTTRANDGESAPRRSFRDYVSRFGYSTGSPGKQLSQDNPVLPPAQPTSPVLKRKRSQALKRKVTSHLDPAESSIQEAESPTPKRKSTPRTRKAASASASPASPGTPIISKLHDTLRPNLTLVLIGLNPGIMTANTGHPYSHPSNGFWKILYSSGITPIQHRPQDHPLLPDLYGIGNTNICARPSRLGSELTKAELAEGAKILDDKIATYRPEAACISGKGVWEAIWIYKTGRKKMPKDGVGAFQYGWQDDRLRLGRTVDAESGEVVWEGAMTFVAPSTSGLNAGMRPAEKEEAWRPIGEWMRKKREQRGMKLETVKMEQKITNSVAMATKDLDPFV